MRIFRLAALIIGFIAGVTACKKELDGLRDGLLKNDVKLVTKNIGSLLSSYSEGNLDLLANEITDRCNISATVDCFNCIKTNPPQTEIIFSLVQQGGTVQKRLDISYTSNNKMVLLNVHD
jgi:hypothetical protein